MSGPEQFLVLELQASVVGKKLPSDEYKKVANLAGSLISGGSANWPAMGWAVGYRLAEPGARAQWEAFFPASRKTFMGDEEFSTIYGLMHLLSVAAVHDHAVKAGDSLAAGALHWMQFWFAAAELMRATGDGTILMPGMRSGGHPPLDGAIWNGWIRALARGESLATWEAAGKKQGLGMKQNWAYATAKALQPSLAAAVAGNPALPVYGLMSHIHVYQTDQGIAVWCEKNVNSNTTPLMAGVEIFGNPPAYLPPNGGARIRERFENVTCTRNGTSLIYTSDLQGQHELPLPGGTVVRDITLGA